MHVHVICTLNNKASLTTGRLTAHDVAAFARDSSQTPLIVLGPQHFPRIVDSGDPWIIDFYAPVRRLSHDPHDSAV